MVITANFNSTWFFEAFIQMSPSPCSSQREINVIITALKWGKLRHTELNYLLKDVQQISSRDGNANQFSQLPSMP